MHAIGLIRALINDALTGNCTGLAAVSTAVSDLSGIAGRSFPVRLGVPAAIDT